MNRDDFLRRQFLDNAWRRAAGRSEHDGLAVRDLDLDDLAKTEWSPEFEGFMRRRLIFGAIRYGRLGASGKSEYDRLAAIRKRLDEYEQTGNLELLVDCANLCLIEFVEGRHPERHFASADDGEHVGVK